MHSLNSLNLVYWHPTADKIWQPQGQQEPLVDKDQVVRLKVSKCIHGMRYFSFQCSDTVGWATGNGIWRVKISWVLVCW